MFVGLLLLHKGMQFSVPSAIYVRTHEIHLSVGVLIIRYLKQLTQDHCSRTVDYCGSGHKRTITNRCVVERICGTVGAIPDKWLKCVRTFLWCPNCSKKLDLCYTRGTTIAWTPSWWLRTTVSLFTVDFNERWRLQNPMHWQIHFNFELIGLEWPWTD